MMIVRFVFISLLISVVSGCAVNAPTNTQNACSIYEQRNAFYNNWYRQTKKAERKYGIPTPILLATIQQESAFRPRVKPPRKKVLGVFPGKRLSSSKGYSQALKSTWETYKKSAGKPRASRTRYKDAVMFVGWYHNQSHIINGIRKNDAYNLYLAYYAGHGGFKRKSFTPGMTAAASKVAARSKQYEQQLRQCKKL